MRRASGSDFKCPRTRNDYGVSTTFGYQKEDIDAAPSLAEVRALRSAVGERLTLRGIT
jgi:hypothetical protein